MKPEHDAAMANLGGHWRMPTETEIKELIDKSKREWKTVDDIKGIRVTGPNGNTVFFPASGYRGIYGGTYNDAGYEGYYWSSTHLFNDNGRHLNFDSGK